MEKVVSMAAVKKTAQDQQSAFEQQLETSGQAMVTTAQEMAITTQKEYEAAGEVLVEIKTRAKQVKDYWKGPKEAAHAAHQAVVQREKQMLAPLAEAEKIIKQSMVNYQAAVEKARQEAEAAARRRQEEEAARLLDQAVSAEESGDDQAAAIGLAMAEMVSDMQSTTQIDAPKASGISVSRPWKARVVDEKAVPAYMNGMELRKIDMSALNNIAKMTKGQMEIPGVEFYQDFGISASAR